MANNKPINLDLTKAAELKKAIEAIRDYRKQLISCAAKDDKSADKFRKVPRQLYCHAAFEV